MTRASSTTGALLAAAMAITTTLHVEGGIYVLTPTSRQVSFSPAFKDMSFENLEYCPGCYNAGGPDEVRARGEANTNGGLFGDYGDGEWPLLHAAQKGEVAENGNFLERGEIAVRHGVCGDPPWTADEDTNTYSTPNSDWPTLATFQAGEVLDIKVVVTEYLYGHLEFFICDSEDLRDGRDSVADQECLNRYPLTRAEGDSIHSPVDPAYPGRYYVDPPCRAGESRDQAKPEGVQDGYVMHMSYQLPDGLTCEHCVLQMVYYTGNSCKHLGYDSFEPASWPSQCAPDKEDWIDVDHWLCGLEGTYPQEFWGCSDIAITLDAQQQPSTPSPTTASPTEVRATPPTPSPSVAAEIDSPTPCPGAAMTTTAGPTGVPIPAAESAAPSPAGFGVGDTWAPTTSSFEDDYEYYCDFPALAYEQCGGSNWKGSRCCEQGYECISMGEGDCYWQCRPAATVCADLWSQCGGLLWRGASCCPMGATCVETSVSYSSCQPDVQ